MEARLPAARRSHGGGLVEGPVLAETGAWVGGQDGVLLGAVVFTALVAVLVASAVWASRDMHAGAAAVI